MFGNIDNPGSTLTAERIQHGSVGVELGVYEGDTSQKFLNRSLCHLYMIDSWDADFLKTCTEIERDAIKKHVGLFNYTDNYIETDQVQRYFRVMKRFSSWPNVTILRTTSRIFLRDFEFSPLRDPDWIYIDTAHDYLNVIIELRSSWEVLKSGKQILGDDYDEYRHPEVYKAWNDFATVMGVELNNFAMDQVEIIVQKD